jgi:8-amino-7-oxononanoate synthase
VPDSANDALAGRIRERLHAIREGRLERSLRPPSGLDLSSNDYLGLSTHPRVVQAMVAAIEREGVGSTGSRLLRGDREAFAEIERRFAVFKGAERALYFSSGYLANLAVLTTFAEGGDVILSDSRNHASLIDAGRLSSARRIVFPHRDVGALAQLLSRPPSSGHTFVVTESLFSMDGDVPPLAEYAALCRQNDATLIVDEAHAVGIYGTRGSGLLEESSVESGVESGVDAAGCVSINTAGKALGVSGAFVAGPAWAIDYLIQRARPFIFSTAAPPALAAAIGASLDVIAAEPDRRTRLMDRVKRLRAALSSSGLPVPPSFSQIVPIVIGENERALDAAAALQAQGFDVRAIRPPSVAPGTARLRISVNVTLTDDAIDAFVHALAVVVGAGVAGGISPGSLSWSAASS